jgi:hypothetical protein
MHPFNVFPVSRFEANAYSVNNILQAITHDAGFLRYGELRDFVHDLGELRRQDCAEITCRTCSFDQMPPEQKSTFVDGIFDIIFTEDREAFGDG